MHILLNATTLRKGGALQRAVSFVQEIENEPLGHQWSFALSDILHGEIERFGRRGGRYHVFPVSPSRSRESRRYVRSLERSLSPDCVFTLAGPAYVQFRAPHLIGCADGWTTHSTWQAYRTLSFPDEWFDIGLTTLYKFLWFRRADAWVVQTETAKQGLHRRIHVPLEQIAIVANTCAANYRGAEPVHRKLDADHAVRILCFSARYKHKCLDMIPGVAKRLTELDPTFRFEFVLTLHDDCDIWRDVQRSAQSLGVSQYMRNRGPIAVADGPDLYNDSDICFLPTVLETFSATYPEALAMEVPIITSDLGFARNVCQDAALYFAPRSASSAAEVLLRVARDESLRDRLIRAGRRVVQALPTPEEQCREYVRLLENMVGRTTSDARVTQHTLSRNG